MKSYFFWSVYAINDAWDSRTFAVSHNARGAVARKIFAFGSLVRRLACHTYDLLRQHDANRCNVWSRYFCAAMGRIARTHAVVLWRRFKPVFATHDHRVGALIVLFSSRYFDGDPRAGRFLATLFAFMGSMLGVVLADNMFALFVFWELTGFTSFLLIGFDQERAQSRSSAIQAFVVTGTGGMASTCCGGTHRASDWAPTNLSALIAGGASVRQSAAYHWIAGLVLLAAFTKSAQTPFHFWLPNAMAAPTPSAHIFIRPPW